MKINNFIFFQLLLSIFNFLWISADCQVLTPFTFGDIQRRVGDAFDVSNATTATARQSDNFQQTTFGDSLEPGTSFFKDNLGPDNFFISSNFDDDDFFKTPTKTDAMTDVSKTTTGHNDSLPTSPTTPTSTLNPFEPLLSDPSSFVSTLTSLHLHLSEDDPEKSSGKAPKSPDFIRKNRESGQSEAKPVQDTDLFQHSFDFPDSGFGSKTNPEKSGVETSPVESKPDVPDVFFSRRSFGSVSDQDEKSVEDSKPDESRDAKNFFSVPFPFSGPVFGPDKSGLSGPPAAASTPQETLSRDGDHHGGGGGGGYQVSIHGDSGGYHETPHHDDGKVKFVHM